VGIYWRKEPIIIGGSWGIPVSLQALGDIALAVGNDREARQYYRHALELARDTSYVELRLHVLLGPIKWLARKGNLGTAVELAALTLHHPASVEETQSKAQELLAGLQRQLEFAAFAAAQERGQARDLDATVRELVFELGKAESA
jgi:hypothetical protein